MSSILQYYKRVPKGNLPNPDGTLSRVIPSAAIASANKEVRLLTEAARKSKRGPYHKYTPEQRADIGKYAVQHGVVSAKRKYSMKLDVDLNESTVRGFKMAYLDEVNRKRKADEDDISVTKLPTKKRGRPVLLGAELDTIVQQYIMKLRQNKATVNTAVVIAGARGILLSLDRSRLSQYGGPATLTESWAKSILKRMNFTKRRGTTKASIPVEAFNARKSEFLQTIIDIVTMEEIPQELIFNWDQTGLNLVPASSWTMDQKGAKRVEIKGLNDKRQITGVFCGSMVGEFLPIQLIYGGKTRRCHPPYSFPTDWNVTHSQNHWSNELTMLEYIDKVIVPFVERVRDDLGKDKEQAALAIFDHFRGQLTANVTAALEKHNIHSAIVPATCTDRLQPMDLSVNRSAKCFLRRKFQEWYSDQISEQLTSQDDLEELKPVDMSTALMKCVGGPWLVQLFEYLSQSPHIIINGFLAADIPQSLDAGHPIIEGQDSDSGTGDDTGTDDDEDDTTEDNVPDDDSSNFSDADGEFSDD